MELEFSLNKPADFVFDHLRDMQKFVSVHPIIYKIEPLGKNKYKVYEKLKLLFVPMDFTYIVTLEEDAANKQLRISTRVKNMVNIKMHFMVSGDADKCLVKEIIQFESYMPVHPLMRSIFRKQHQQLFQNIGKS